MRTAVLSRFNALFAFLVGLLGFTGCERDVMVKYGVPSSDFTLDGEVTNQQEEPLQNIQIESRGGWKDGAGNIYWSTEGDKLYSGLDGRFCRTYRGEMPYDYYRIIATDTAGVYAPDTIETTVSYTGGDGDWYMGNGYLHVTFVLSQYKTRH